jgi:hypothetical protein
MFPTLELRWFFRHEPCAPSLFFNAAHLSEPRTDWYAYPCDERSGVKIREGRLEAKLLIASLGPRDFPRATGNVEHWQKWSADLPAADRPSSAQLRSAGWVAVEKRRYLRKFAIDGPSIRELDADDFPHSGAQFEWTQLTADQQPWCTLGFESFGPDAQLDHNLTSLVKHVFENAPLPAPLKIGDSFGYPKWLDQLSKESLKMG